MRGPGHSLSQCEEAVADSVRHLPVVQVNCYGPVEYFRYLLMLFIEFRVIALLPAKIR